MTKGEINFREREIELKSLKDELTNLRNELKVIILIYYISLHKIKLLVLTN